MPRRKIGFATGEIYHIFNRSLNQTLIFIEEKIVNYFLDALVYYLKENPPVSYSTYHKTRNKDIYPNSGKDLVQIYGYVLMPNHFHVLLKQRVEKGIQFFIQRLINSFSHMYNEVHKRKGPLFESTFKSVHTESEDQLIHTMRYIDLNPSTSLLVDDPSEYTYSSYLTHIGQIQTPWIDTKFILDRFKTFAQYKKFVLDNKDYQRSLHALKLLS